MPTYAFQTIWQGPSGLAKDRFVNTTHWHNGTIGPLPTDFDNVRDMLKDFYGTAPTGQKVCSYMTSLLSPTAQVKAYNLSEPKPRAPVYESSFIVTGLGATNPQPFEVALCMSFEANKASGEIQARRRNRIYIGPLNVSSIHTSGRPQTSCITDIVNAGDRMRDAAAAATSWDWHVYSPTNDEIYAVDKIWCDDAWDTQRRRGLNPTTRVISVA